MVTGVIRMGIILVWSDKDKSMGSKFRRTLQIFLEAGDKRKVCWVLERTGQDHGPGSRPRGLNNCGVWPIEGHESSREDNRPIALVLKLCVLVGVSMIGLTKQRPMQVKPKRKTSQSNADIFAPFIFLGIISQFYFSYYIKSLDSFY